MFYDAVKNDHGFKHDPFKAMIVPRPIGWISSRSKDGVDNLAPYSFFNAVSDRPHILMFSSTGYKDNIRNIDETGEFVFNLTSFELREAMNVSSASVSPDVDEFALAGLEKAPCEIVSVPRVKAAPIAMECKHLKTIELFDLAGETTNSWMVMGQVVGIHIDDSIIDGDRVCTEKVRPVARLGYMDYASVDSTFSIERPKVDPAKQPAAAE